MTAGRTDARTPAGPDHTHPLEMSMAKAHRSRVHWCVTHGHAFVGNRSPEYRTWNNMTQRCTNPKHTNFHRYGGRGITVCERWLNSFAAFLEDMGPKPTPKHEIERKDNDKGYSPDNCRWATHKEQCRNFGRNRLLTFDGKTMCISAWAEHLGIHRQTLKHRLDSGWTLERALTTVKSR